MPESWAERWITCCIKPLSGTKGACEHQHVPRVLGVLACDRAPLALELLMRLDITQHTQHCTGVQGLLQQLRQSPMPSRLTMQLLSTSGHQRRRAELLPPQQTLTQEVRQI